MTKFHCDCGFVVDKNEVEYCPECGNYRCKWCFISQSLVCHTCRVKQYQLDSINEITELLNNDNESGDNPTKRDNNFDVEFD